MVMVVAGIPYFIAKVVLVFGNTISTLVVVIT